MWCGKLTEKLGLFAALILVLDSPAKAFEGSDCQFYLTNALPAETRHRVATLLVKTGVPPVLGELDEYYETGMEHVGFVVYSRDVFEAHKKALGPLWDKLDQINTPISVAELDAHQAKKALFGVSMDLFYRHVEEGDWILLLDQDGKIIADTKIIFAIVQFKSLLNTPIFQPMPENIEPDLWLKAVENRSKVIIFKSRTANPDSPAAHQAPFPPFSDQ